MNKVDVIEYTRADIIRMENDNQSLPEGVTRTKYGSYRLYRNVNGKKYYFGSIRSLELALRVNKGVDEMSNDFKDLVASSKQLKLDELTLQVKILQEIVLDLSDERKPFWQRIFGR